MIIRSQKGMVIVIVDNVDTIVTNSYGDIGVYNGGANTKVGIAEYSTKEKAIKVLDMICEHYQYLQECKYTGVGINKPEFIFQMPKEQEVE